MTEAMYNLIHQQTHALLEQNWVHSSPKYGLRFDGEPPRVGRNGVMQSNVVWRCGGVMVKGDNHTVLHNLVFDKWNKKKGDHQGDRCALFRLKVRVQQSRARQQRQRGHVQCG